MYSFAGRFISVIKTSDHSLHGYKLDSKKAMVRKIPLKSMVDSDGLLDDVDKLSSLRYHMFFFGII